MDPAAADAIGAVVVAAANSAAGEAGRQAWTSLVGTVRRAFGRRTVPTSAGETALVTAADPSDAESLRDLVLAWAGEDPELLRELVRWESEHRGVLESRDDSVTNTISGNATIHGPVIQARDVSGTFNSGGPS
ncbi:hypothetical protein [Actinacidiphila oryziradicis]|uniref:hypothetical protein n=1 Tax=Actinacidiphila oryziradicis TaxID=2571141 RepID=UPI00145CAF06|nr:hypothetical protein [Actinacidiphila oryziradicis]